MKKAWIAIPLALVLAGCGGNYPSEAVLEFDSERPSDITLSGVLLEMNSDVKDNLPRITAMRQEIREYLDAPDENSLSFWRDISRERRDRIEALRDEHAEAQATRMRQYDDWKAETTSNLEEARSEKDSTDAEWERFQSFVGEAEARLTEVNTKIQTAEARQTEIGNEVRQYTNQRIIDEQLAVRQLNPRASALSWSSTRWRDGVDISNQSCAPRDGRVTLDLSAEDRSCVYIEYPVAQLANEEYDELLRKSTLEYLRLNRDIGQNSSWNRKATGLRGELQEAREGVQNAQILAENQTGTTARNLESRRSQLNTRIERTEQQLNTAAEQLEEGNFAAFLPVDRNLGRQTSRELRGILDEHLEDSINQLIDGAILNQADIDNDGYASGLSRKGKYLVALVNATEHGLRGRTSVEHIAVLEDVSATEPTVRDKKLIIKVDDPLYGRGNYDAEGRVNDLVFRLFMNHQE